MRFRFPSAVRTLCACCTVAHGCYSVCDEKRRSDDSVAWGFNTGLVCLCPRVSAARCEDRLNLKHPDTVVKSAEPVTHTDLPAYCRVVASVKGSPDSDIAGEIWLPRSMHVMTATGKAITAAALPADNRA